MSDDTLPEPARHLSTEARALWRTLYREHEFEAHEEKTLRLALEALDRASTARRAVRRLGLVYLDRFGQPHARPEVAIERDPRLAYVKLMDALGLEPEEPPAQLRARGGTFARKAPRGQGRVALAKAATRG